MASIPRPFRWKTSTECSHPSAVPAKPPRIKSTSPDYAGLPKTHAFRGRESRFWCGVTAHLPQETARLDHSSGNGNAEDDAVPRARDRSDSNYHKDEHPGDLRIAVEAREPDSGWRRLRRRNDSIRKHSAQAALELRGHSTATFQSNSIDRRTRAIVGRTLTAET